MSITEVKKHLKKKTFAKIYAFYGNEGYLRRYYVNEIMELSTKKEFKDFNRTIFAEGEFTIDAFSNAVENYPMYDERRVILIENYAPPASEVKKLSPVIENIPEFSTVIFEWNETISPEKKCPAFLKALKKYDGVVCKCNRPNAKSLAKWIRKHFAIYHKKIDDDALSELMELGENMDLLQQEIIKLVNFEKGEIITLKDVHEIVPPTLESRIFILTDAVTSGNGKKAFKICDELFAQKYEPVLISGAISSNIIRLHKVKIAIAQKLNTEEMLKFIGMRNERSLRGLMYAAKGVTTEYLEAALESCKKADLSLKSGRMDKNVILELLIGELLFLRCSV